jgi:lipoate-protein ligase A
MRPQPNLKAKSVDSVRSPVATLRSARKDVSHDDFITAVASEFHTIFSQVPSYGEGRNPVHNVDEGILEDGDDRAEYIRKGMEELKVSFALWPKTLDTETNGFK